MPPSLGDYGATRRIKGITGVPELTRRALCIIAPTKR